MYGRFGSFYAEPCFSSRLQEVGMYYHLLPGSRLQAMVGRQALLTSREIMDRDAMDTSRCLGRVGRYVGRQLGRYLCVWSSPRSRLEAVK